jgi:hypothetical protein
MDRITTSLLSEFCSEHGLGRESEDRQFEHFSSYLAVTRNYAETFDTADVVVGGGNDLGIDGIACIVNGTLVTDPDLIQELAATNGYIDAIFVFVQADRSASFESAKLGSFAFGVRDFFSDAPKLPRNTMITSSAEVMAEVYKFSSKFKNGNPVCRLYYMTTGKWTADPALEGRRNAEIQSIDDLRLFREVEIIPIDADKIQRFYNETKNKISREFVFPVRTVIPDIPGVNEAYLGLIPARDFLSLIEDENGDIIRSLFYDNVRDWQDFNPVNDDIKQTIESKEERPRFALMNNGITVIAKKMRGTGNRFCIEDYQVVNGCQTSHVLYHCRQYLDQSIMVPLRLIATDNEDVISAIIKATNRQTEVKEEHLLALSDFSKKLEAFFPTFQSQPLYYERRSKQYNGNPNIEKTRVITPGSLIRSFASVFLEEPHRATRSYRTLLEGVGKTFFAADHRLEPYYVAAFTLYRLEFLFRNYALDAKYKPARYHILLATRILAAPDTLPRMNSHEMRRYCEGILEILWNPDKSDACFRAAANVVDSVAQGNFHRDHIRTQPFTESLIESSKKVHWTS